MRVKDIFAISLILVLGGCSSLEVASIDSSGQIQGEESSSESSTKNVDSPWNCDSKTDALGTESTFCSSSYEDKDNGLFWTLGFLCSFDRFTGHSITAISTYNGNMLLWRNGATEADVKINNSEIETWQMESISDGEGLFYANSNSRNKSTWNFLSRISSAETFAIRARTAKGNFASAKFNVAESVRFAAVFNAMGCNSSSG
jgi:hypothetical protein